MTAPDVVARFLAAAREQSCTTHAPLEPERVAGFVAERCAALGGLVAISHTEPLVPTRALVSALHTAGVESLEPEATDWRARVPTAAVGVTSARVAVAELGVFALDAAAGRPRSVSLLPETHICVVADRDVLDTLTDALARVARAPLPSALLWIGGPSRTGDLEMIVTLGVHGPRAVEIVVVDTAG